MCAEPVLEDAAGHVSAWSLVHEDVHGLALVVAEVLHPVVACLPGNGHECRQEEAPGKEPDQVEEPVGGKRQLVVVVRVSLTKEAQVMLVDEVEVPETVDVADGGVVADGVPLVGIGQSAKDVPGRGDGEEKQRAGYGLQKPPAAPQAGQEQVGNGRADKECGGDQSLGEQGKRQGRPHPVKAHRPARLEAGEQAVKGDEQEEA